MNASQRRIARRSLSRALSVLGIIPGSTLSRTPPKKTTSTEATLVGVSMDNPRHLTVKTRDNRVRDWPLMQCYAHGLGWVRGLALA